MKKNLREILFVEDNQEDADLTLKFFAKNNVATDEVLHIRTGDEAWSTLLDALRNKTLPKLIIIDLSLPGMKGVELIRKIKLDQSLKNIPVIVLTGSKSDQDIIETFQLRVEAHLIKPIDIFKLRKILMIGGFPIPQ